jgi:hypothetical protein
VWYCISDSSVLIFSPKYVLGNTKYGINCFFSLGWLLCPSIQIQHHMSGCNFILVNIVIIHIDTKVNKTFDACCSMMCTLVLIEKINYCVCAINMHVNRKVNVDQCVQLVLNFKLHSNGCQLKTIIQLHKHNTNTLLSMSHCVK